MTDPTPLMSGFPAIDRAQWRDLVAKTLSRGRSTPVSPDDAERLLVTPTDDGYSLHGLYTAADIADLPIPALPGTRNFVRGSVEPPARAGWDIRARHWVGPSTGSGTGGVGSGTGGVGSGTGPSTGSGTGPSTGSGTGPSTGSGTGGVGSGPSTGSGTGGVGSGPSTGLGTGPSTGLGTGPSTGSGTGPSTGSGTGVGSGVGGAIADDLANGVTSLWLTDGDAAAFAEVLEGIDLTQVAVVCEGYRDSVGLGRALLAAGAASGAPMHPSSCLGLDPIGVFAATGRSGDLDDVVDLAHEAAAAGIRAFTIDATPYAEAGASFAEELAATTAAGLATLRILDDAGIAPAQAAELFEFRWIVTDDQFGSIAKLRAARVLWDRVLEVAGVPGGQRPGQVQHAATSVAMLTARDPWVNLIRNCVAAFAAGAGGAAAITVEPHALAQGPVDELSRRMARNTQLLLLQESHVGVVADPAGGSYYVERRTNELADAAWAWLQDIEAAGGMRSALANGTVAARLDRTWRMRADAIAHRRTAVTGINEFPDRERRTAPVPGWQRPGGGLPQHRYAEAFEALRDRSDTAPVPPTVALVTLGPLAQYGAREAFAQNLFAAGGVATVSMPYDPDRALELPAGVRVACLCGTDDAYAEAVALAGPAITRAGAARLLVAGKPGDREATDAAAGVSGHVFAGCDALAVLEQVLLDAEVPA